MEKHLNLWDLEKIARQYVGFNQQVIKEYHMRFREIDGRIHSTNGYLILQWRTIYRVRDLGYKFIYTFRPPETIRSFSERVISLPSVVFEDNAYRASALKEQVF